MYRLVLTLHMIGAAVWIVGFLAIHVVSITILSLLFLMAALPSGPEGGCDPRMPSGKKSGIV